MPGDIDHRSLTLDTADGETLHGDLAVPRDPVATAAVAHPHPLMGGDRHNAVVDAVVRALTAAGVATVRFDFRGVGDSTGAFGKGVAERLDMEAALRAAADAAPGAPLWSIGYSFGGDVALSVDRPDLVGWVAIAPPLSSVVDDPPPARDERPAMVFTPAHDQFCPPDLAHERTAWWENTMVVEVPSTDHFMNGRLSAVADSVVEALRPA
ncbi:MAG: alpha/beta hydrolase [Acidimicrobiales bacterium]